MPTAAPLIDLDAGKREVQFPDGIPVKHAGVDYLLPAELPADCLDAIVDLDLPSLMKTVLDALEKPKEKEDDDSDGAEDLGQVILDVLLDQPSLPKDLLDAVKGPQGVFASLFQDQYATFVGNKPSINDYLRLAQALLPLYGVGLGEALGSSEPSESDGETSSPTSPSTTPASTPAASGSPRRRRSTSASGGSAT